MEITVDLEDEDRLHLNTVDVDVQDSGSIAFRVEGRITGLDESTLEAVADRSLRPTAVTFVST